ncbi:MAG TPA: transcriptional regulator FtrA [Stenotrophomonas sp.]|jgi:AraC family transcriptional activator FtrA
MPIRDQIMPTRRAPAPRARHHVAVLVYDGLCMFEFACAAEVFGLPRPEAGEDWYRFSTVSLDGKPVDTQYTGRMTPDGGLATLARADTVLVPGWAGADVPVPPTLVRALQRAHARGARLLSICSGVFVLAATGLLDDRRATTHWRHAAGLAAKYPRVRVDPAVLYVDEGQLLTSAGSAAGLDLCLHLVRRDHGSAMANQVARRLVIPPHREGGQAQYVERPVATSPGTALAALLDQVRRSLDQPHSIASLAMRAHMSERTLIRHFKAATGQAPGQWLLAQRLLAARDLLEQTSLSVDMVAERCGFGTAITLRHHFRARLRTSPGDYRRRFAAQAPTA